MARNEDGEFELMLGNKQLISLFFLMVALLGLCFVGGYALGRSATPVLTAASTPAPQPVRAAETPVTAPAEPTKVEPAPSQLAKSEPAPAVEPAGSTKAPVRTAPQVAEGDIEPAKTPKAETKAETKAKVKSVPPPAEKQAAAPKEVPAPKQVAAKQGPASGQPVAGRIYLQLSATDKDKAEVMVDLLRRKNFTGIAAPVAEKPGLFRVLVGPLAEGALAQTKTQLKASGFPGDQAIRRVF